MLFIFLFDLYLYCFRHQFVPQIVFLNSLFGYLSLLIIVKWCTGSQADLYHVMIYMFLSPTDDLGENQLFVGQKFFQVRNFIFYLDTQLLGDTKYMPHLNCLLLNHC